MPIPPDGPNPSILEECIMSQERKKIVPKHYSVPYILGLIFLGNDKLSTVTVAKLFANHRDSGPKVVFH